MNSKIAKFTRLLAVAALSLFSGYSQTAPPTLSPEAGEIVKLAEAGTSDAVMLGYIQNSQAPYNLSADDVVYLKDVGISSPVITAMLNHDKAPSTQTYVYNQQLYPPTGNPPATTEPPAPPPLPDNPAPAPPPASASVPPVAPAPAAAAVSTAPPPEVNYFYNSLTPYGSWVDLEGYGWCWQPSVVVTSHGWRPYCDGGHWVYTDGGWFWASDYSWGWAAFHYGRWHLHPRCGWVWFPDTVWAPAWVVWRSSGDSCGWAPLPYGAAYDTRLGFRYNGVSVAAGFDFGLGVSFFTFVGFNNFTSHDLVHVRYAPADCDRVFHQTTVNHEYSVDKNHYVVNHGIPVERISTATHTQIHAVAIHDLPPGSGKPVAHEGANTAVYRHELGKPAHETTPVTAQRVNNNNPVIRHGPALPTSTATHGATPPPPHVQNNYSGAPHETTGASSTGNHPVNQSEHAISTDPSSSKHYTPPKQTAEQNDHVYHPKGYNQASSVHMLPPDPSNVEPHTPAPAPPGHQVTSSPRAQASQNQSHAQPSSGQSHEQSSQGQSHGESSQSQSHEQSSQSQGQSHAQGNQPPK